MPDLNTDQLKEYDGRTSTIYISINGTIFDVSASASMYSVELTGGKGYSVFVGREASRCLAKSSLDPNDLFGEDALSPEEQTTLDKWTDFFTKKYPVVGRLVA